VPAAPQNFRVMQNQQVDIGKRMKLAAAVTAHRPQADHRSPVKLLPGVRKNAVDKEGALIHPCASVRTRAEPDIQLGTGRRQRVLEYGDDRLLTQCPAKAALVKKE